MDPCSESTVLWRLRAPDGTPAHATFIPGHPQVTLVWIIGEQLERAENFEDWDLAFARAEDVRRDLLAAGWWDAGGR